MYVVKENNDCQQVNLICTLHCRLVQGYVQ